MTIDDSPTNLFPPNMPESPCQIIPVTVDDSPTNLPVLTEGISVSNNSPMDLFGQRDFPSLILDQTFLGKHKMLPHVENLHWA